MTDITITVTEQQYMMLHILLRSHIEAMEMHGQEPDKWLELLKRIEERS